MRLANQQALSKSYSIAAADEARHAIYSVLPGLSPQGYRRTRRLIMAQRTVLIDDFDESEASQTVQFGYRGKSYEIDLSDEHAQEFDKLIGRYIDAARESTAPARVPTLAATRRERQGSGGSRSPEELTAIREWARAHGHQVGDRGRIAKEIVEAFEAAQGTGQAAAKFSG